MFFMRMLEGTQPLFADLTFFPLKQLCQRVSKLNLTESFAHAKVLEKDKQERKINKTMEW